MRVGDRPKRGELAARRAARARSVRSRSGSPGPRVEYAVAVGVVPAWRASVDPPASEGAAALPPQPATSEGDERERRGRAPHSSLSPCDEGLAHRAPRDPGGGQRRPAREPAEGQRHLAGAGCGARSA